MMTHEEVKARATALAEKHTKLALLRGKVFTHKLASNEVLTVGRDIKAVGASGWAVHGYNRGACRTETFTKVSEAVRRFMELAHA